MEISMANAPSSSAGRRVADANVLTPAMKMKNAVKTTRIIFVLRMASRRAATGLQKILRENLLDAQRGRLPKIAQRHVDSVQHKLTSDFCYSPTCTS
mmetsp:Transcript_6873/g.9868  ORF Transcript_6873/g.9868 Transcript_6873/m.9868 type:complete len:97 (-) Transcript_6873:60-350(-)